MSSKLHFIRNPIFTLLFFIWIMSPFALLGLGFETAAKIDTWLIIVCGIIFMIGFGIWVEFEEARKSESIQ